MLPDADQTALTPQLIGGATSGTLTCESNGQSWLAGYSAVGPMGWRFVVEQPATAALAAGIACWLIYGVALANWPLIGSNAITLALVMVILALKLRHG